MAEHKEGSLIGYDPLAWMLEETQSPPGIAPVKLPDGFEIASVSRQEELLPHSANSVSMSVENSAMLLTKDAESAASQPDVSTGIQTSAILLDSILNIQNVANLHERLVFALDNSSRISLDASAVSVADTASLQLLLILKRTAIKLQKEVLIDFPSDRFIEAADLLGISEMLEVDQAAAGLF